MTPHMAPRPPHRLSQSVLLPLRGAQERLNGVAWRPVQRTGDQRLKPVCRGLVKGRESSAIVAAVTLVPDWVCEVLSPSTRKVDLHEKRPVYAREGVTRLWLVDPSDRTLEAFELHEGQWLLIASAKDDDPVSIRPFDAITFSLGDLWP